ncbi:MAG: TauD/TfdA family dioxygenase [Proteobacteria bacterium]|nr:TauD/TfdA family dioxygenase [Pseudomonadota bacterium]
MKVEKISPSMGAIVYDLDLTKPLPQKVLTELRDVWLENLMIVIRGQSLSSEQYLNFSKQIGHPDVYPFLKGLDGYDMITPVLKRETEKINFGGVWHTDTTYQECPPMATMLYALELPPVGGDTLFSNQYLAYDTLSDGLKKTLKELRAVCRSDKSTVSATRSDRILESGKQVKSEALIGIHPVVRTHPETKKKCLFVNPAHTGSFEGWSDLESSSLLNFIFNHQVQEEFRCRHVWELGDLALWDNRCALHYPVNDYFGHRRLLHRITLSGDRPY